MKLFRKILRLFYPQRCPYCGKVMEPFEESCGSCTGENTPGPGGYFIKAPGEELSIFCCSPWLYRGRHRQAVLNFKFNHRREYAEPLGVSMARCAKEHFRERCFDLVCEVPLNRKRRKERGYDQSKLLAKEISRELRVSYQSLLEKPAQNRIQHKLSYEQRWENVKGVYRLKSNADVSGKRILLCDDIITSGATLWEAASVLRAAGAKEVCGLSFCRAVKEEREG